MLKEATTPINVVIQSDTNTFVTVRQVGELGQFTERSVSLLPGDYVATGRRDGYRDVRQEFQVRFGQKIPVIVVACSDQVKF